MIFNVEQYSYSFMDYDNVHDVGKCKKKSNLSEVYEDMEITLTTSNK